MVLILPGFVYSQASQKSIDSLKTYIAQLEKAVKNKQIIVGQLTLLNKNYPIYDNQVQIASSAIDSIEMNVVDGFIYDVRVYTGQHGTFTNLQAPIAVTDRRLNGGSTVDFLSNKDGENVILQELLEFKPLKGYAPGDTIFVIKKGKETISLIQDVSINSIFEIKLFTDAIALFGGESNGLAQTEIKYKQFIHRHNLFDKGGFLFQYFKFDLLSSKFDSKYKYTDSADYSRPKFLQRSFVSAEFSFNLFNTWLEKKSTQGFYIDIGGGLAISRLSRKHDSINDTYTMPYFLSEAGFNFKRSENIGLNFSGAWINTYMPPNAYTGDKDCVNFVRINAEFYYNPFDNRSSRLFAKVNYIMSGRLKEQKDNYFQVQIGYSVQLSKLLSKN
jgi:hypothetical protein